ncbi:MAG TPA: DNA repair protein RadA [Candidatus Omnitrophota bacterium]|nr:DNA repair protein RadA [Candidatus Omnitrophota bacterium]
MKTKQIYTCQHCGYQSAKWLGKCPDCNAWNSFVEETFDQVPAKTKVRAALYKDAPVLLKDVQPQEALRVKTGIAELDRVLGGGIVRGSVVLIGGDPGIGKSTISLQISNQLTHRGLKVLYISGEESVAQTKLRAQRLAPHGENDLLYIVNQTDLSLISEYIRQLKPELVIIDSIQVLFDPQFTSSPGSVTQVRECAGILTQMAKTTGTTVFIIGHVTKEGTLAGPRVLEHIVDTVLYFEGDRFSTFRLLRAVKNRFGSTNEIGVFEMMSDGLKEVGNPSELFLAQRPHDAAGSVVVATVEGSRPLLVEVQALVSRASFGYARRRSQGFDFNRLALLVAVLEKRIGLGLEAEDIFLNVVGGIQVEDPAVDTGVCLAVASAFLDRPIPGDVLALGEVGLTGEIRSISQPLVRINEAAKLGFKRCILPRSNLRGLEKRKFGIELIAVTTLKEALDCISGKHS